MSRYTKNLFAFEVSSMTCKTCFRNNKLFISTEGTSFPVDTRRRFKVYKTYIRRLIEVETTPCVYWVDLNSRLLTQAFPYLF